MMPLLMAEGGLYAIDASKILRKTCTLTNFISVILIISGLLSISDACSSRSTPKPRPPSPTSRPNITFQTYACPEAYAKWYCLNGATCFSVRIGESILYNCECPDGYMGQRCEFKDLDGSYQPSARDRLVVEKAGISLLGVLLFALVFSSIFIYKKFAKRSTNIITNRISDPESGASSSSSSTSSSSSSSSSASSSPSSSLSGVKAPPDDQRHVNKGEEEKRRTAAANNARRPKETAATHHHRHHPHDHHHLQLTQTGRKRGDNEWKTIEMMMR